MKQTAIGLLEQEITQQQKRYISLAEKNKKFKKQVDAILTATTLLKIKCQQLKELEKQQIIDSFDIGYANAIHRVVQERENTIQYGEQYYNETFKK